jgi:magnesium-transporting ATPase (P-type)
MRSIIFLLTCFLVFSLGSCSIVNGIFKAGMVWGILLVVGFIALIIFIIAKVSGGRK